MKWTIAAAILLSLAFLGSCVDWDSLEQNAGEKVQENENTIPADDDASSIGGDDFLTDDDSFAGNDVTTDDDVSPDDDDSTPTPDDTIGNDDSTSPTDDDSTPLDDDSVIDDDTSMDDDTACQADCSGRECGDNGCGGTCGICHGDEQCGPDGQCFTPDPDCPDTKDCSGRECGPDPVCGESCGQCPSDHKCTVGGECQCVSETDLEFCARLNKGCDKVTDFDNCGGSRVVASCGTCKGQEQCINAVCVCQRDCSGKECGDDGCGGSCGDCLSPETCGGGGTSWICGEPLPGCIPICTGGEECGVDGCADPMSPYCDPADCICKEIPPFCETDADCPSYHPHCTELIEGMPEYGVMCKCQTDEECATSPGVGLPATCEPGAGVCMHSCAADSDCAGGKGKWYCKTDVPGYEMCLSYCENDADCEDPTTCESIVEGKGLCTCP